ncbi:MAG: tripartite tricarboxylate transporter TctB family protein [Candidatus Faecousia sp.]|nr:tripartite tricarboxylate transporter TctB family protein [Candidatus Faecousia sp.]
MFFKKYGDIVVSVFFMVLSAVMIFAATLLPKSTVMEIGPDFMPTVVGIVTLILSTALLIISLKGLKTRVAEAEANPPAECDYKRMLISLILILIYVFTLKPVGFIVTTLVYLPVQMYVLADAEHRTKKDIIMLLVIDVVFTLAVFFLFRYGFKIVLPQGIFTINL